MRCLHRHSLGELVKRFLCLLIFAVLIFTTSVLAEGPGVQGHIRVGIFPLEPINFIDNNNNAQGFNPDLLREIAKLQGWTISFVPGSWGEGLERLQKGEIDLMMMVIYTPERAKIMDYTVEPIFEVWGQVFSLPDNAIQSITDLAGKRVAVMRKDMNGGNFIKTAETLGVTCDYLEFNDFAEVFNAVNNGVATAGVAPQHFGLRHAGDFGLIPTSIQFSPVKTYFTTKKGEWHNLLSQIDTQLHNWKADKDSFYYQRLSHWMGIHQNKTEIFPTWLRWTLVAIAFAVSLLLSLNLFLKSQVRKRTAELALSNSELRNSQQSYQNLINSMHQPLALHEIICDENGTPDDYRFLAVNPAFEKLLGKPAAEIVGKRVRELLPSTEHHWIETYGQVALTGEPAHFQNYSSELDRYFEIAAYSPEKNQFAAIITDITQRIKLEEERRRLDDQVLQAQKLESLGVLAGGIAHDFNNILMSVLGHCELALRRIAKESPAKTNLKQIKLSANRAAELANQMLAYSGKGRFIVEPQDLSTIASEMDQMLKVSISKKIVLRYEFAEQLPTVEADATQLRQIILNLVINGSDAIGDRSGVIAISTGMMDCDRIYLSETWLDEGLPEGPYVYLEVADTGCGMDKDTIKRIFEPFFSTKFTGRGLGMAAVLGIVRGHKGAIKIYSEIGRGTTFKILFPATDKPAALLHGQNDLPPIQGSGLVLLVDDDDTVRSIGR